ncbi:proteolipid protein 2 [Gallus gallus]|uniref:proteolipid protein 2 n=1 Tax=Gallus gallus TaxID=9031 RepID=UPI001AE2B624|nr:proteolipid protein 2 [Gallus gallus]
MESSGNRGCAGGCGAFLRSRKGLVLLGEIALCTVALLCYGASRTPGYVGLAVCELIFASIAVVLCITGLHHRVALVHWGWTDFIRCVVGCLLFLITSLIVIIGHRDGAGTAAGVFGLLAGLLLGYDAYISVPTRGGHSAAPTETPEGP